MSNPEIIGSTLGILGFVLGVINFLWLVRSQLPRLSIHPEAPCFFTADLTLKHPILDTISSQRVTIVDALVKISNNSNRDNSVVKVSCSMDQPLLLIETDHNIVTGTKKINLTAVYGTEDVRDVPVYWERPAEHWQDIAPLSLAAGGFKAAHIFYRMDGEPIAGDAKIRLTITVIDAFRRSYRTSIFLNRSATGKDVTPINIP